MFNAHPTEIENTVMGYAPKGFMPYAPVDRTADTILAPGESVFVLSTWDREHYLPGAVLLAFVEGRETGQCTHVPVTDLMPI